MKIGICHTKRSSATVKQYKAFSKGVIANGDETVKIKTIKDADEHLSSCDAVFQICDLTGGKMAPEDKLRGHIIKLCKKYKKRRMILDVGLFQVPGQDPHFSIGFDGIKGAAAFHNENSPSDRRLKRKIDIKPWNTTGRNIYILCQTFRGAGLKHIGEQEAAKYFFELPSRIREYTDRRIIFRMHPKQAAEGKRFKRLDNVKQEIGVDNFDLVQGHKAHKKGIEKSFSDMYCCITRTSAGIIPAILNGVPSISEDDYNICNTVSDRDLSNIENILKPDREQWVNDLCYAEWSMDELLTGEAWSHLRPHVNKNNNESAKTRKSVGLHTTAV